MVLIRICALGGLVLGAAAAAACNQSLFDNHGPGATTDGGGGDAGGPDATVPSSCTEPCLADAGVDFNGTVNGARGNWRYLEDHRDRTWTPMAVMSGLMTGVDLRNHIASCKDNPTFESCQQLPGALLVSSSGATSIGDPAIEFTVAAPTVIQVTLRVYVPGAANQQIRLYRNSREDALYTAIATAGTTLEHTITLDALAKDRFLFAVTPTAQGAANVAVQLFASATGAAFPSSCLLATAFDGATGNTVSDLCKTAKLESLAEPASATPVVLLPGPFTEQGDGASITGGKYLRDNTGVDQSHDLTVQLWVRQRSLIDNVDTAWVFSDIDLDFGGGVGIGIIPPVPGSAPVLIVTTSLDPNPNTYIDATTNYPADGAWHFLRVAQAGGTMTVCLDGTQKTSVAVPAGHLKTTYAPYLGKNVLWSPIGSFFDGQIDDLRVFSTALSCN